MDGIDTSWSWPPNGRMKLGGDEVQSANGANGTNGAKYEVQAKAKCKAAGGASRTAGGRSRKCGDETGELTRRHCQGLGGLLARTGRGLLSRLGSVSVFS